MHTALRDWDARWKLAAVAVLIVGCAAVRGVLPSAGFLVASLGLAFLARLSIREIRTRAMLVGFAILPVVLLAPFTLESGTMLAAGIACRALAIGTLALVLVRTSPVPETLAAARSLRLPSALLQIAQLAHRYTDLFQAEVRRIRIALRTRGFRPRTDTHSYRTLGHALGGVLVRGSDRAERVSAAMRCRGFDGSYRGLATFRTSPRDVLGFAAAAAVAVGLIAADCYR